VYVWFIVYKQQTFHAKVVKKAMTNVAVRVAQSRLYYLKL